MVFASGLNGEKVGNLRIHEWLPSFLTSQLYRIMLFSEMGKLMGELCFGGEVSWDQDAHSRAKWKYQVHNWLGTQMNTKYSVWYSDERPLGGINLLVISIKIA